jgi:hypothetical protein
MKNFELYYKQKSKEERESFAFKAHTSQAYIEIHLLSGKKKPTMDTMQNIADATDGEFQYADIVDFFYKSQQHLFAQRAQAVV